MSTFLGWWRIIVAPALLGAVSALALAAPSGVHAATTMVTVGQQNGGTVAAFQFNPAAVTIQTGDTVQWTLFGGIHNVTSFAETSPGVPQWSSSGFPFSHVFASAGTFTYYCSIHATRAQADPSVIDANIAGGAMVGKVVVHSPSSVGGIAEVPDAGSLAPLAAPSGDSGTAWWRIAAYATAAVLALTAGIVVARRAMHRRA